MEIQQQDPAQVDFKLEIIAIKDLCPHPRNYQAHPADEIQHLIESIEEHGIYKNIVIARDGTILAGHGVKEAAEKMGIQYVPVKRLDLDPNEPRALKILAGDNEIRHLAEIDDRALSELLKEIKERDDNGLLGTGYDEMMLTNLIFVTRPQSEIQDFNGAAEWVGMPDFEPEPEPLKVIFSFRDENDRNEFGRILGLEITDNPRISVWWPLREKRDLSSVSFMGENYG